MQQAQRLTYVPFIDGLRGVAVLSVLLFHLDIQIITGGYVGVDVFFVISGFLITRIVANELKSGTFSFSYFYARRVRRIFPALFAMMFLTSFAAIIFLGPHQFSEFFKALRMASAQISNIFFSREVDYFSIDHENSPLLHTWSLGVEEQFYLLWPLFLLAIHRLIGLHSARFALLLLLAVSLGLSEYLVRTNSLHAFYLLHSRAWELALGGLVALNVLPSIRQVRASDAVSLLGAALLVLPLFLYEKGDFPGVKAIPPCLGTALLLYTGQARVGIAHKLLSWRPLVFIGLLSYSLYLWHWPIISFYTGYFGGDLALHTKFSIGALSLLIAYASYRLVEKPFRTYRLQPRKTLAVGVVMILLFIVASNGIKNENDAPWRVNYQTVEDVRLPHPLDKVCSIEGGAYNRSDCIIGPNKDQYEVILVGDSHASHYTPTVLEWARTKNLTVRLFMRGACSSWLITDDIKMKNGKVDRYCMELTNAFYETLHSDASIQYVILGLMNASGTSDVRLSLERVKSFGKRTVFLGQVPMFRDDPHECQIKNNLLISKWFPRNDTTEGCMELDHQYSENAIGASRSSLLPLLDDLDIDYFDPTAFMQTPFDHDGHFMYLPESVTLPRRTPHPTGECASNMT